MFSDYSLIRRVAASPSDTVVLADADAGRCRICGRREPDITFHGSAHVFPKYMGITRCTSLNVCDSCQQKYPFPSSKETVTTMTTMKTMKTTTTTTTTTTMTTMTTMTTLLRIALTVVPESDLPHFRTTIDLLRGEARKGDYIDYPVNVRTYAAQLPYVSAEIWRRNDDCTRPIPAYILILSYGTTTLEVPIPGCDLDLPLLHTTFSLPILPGPHDTPGSPPLTSDLLHS